jgi:hypothetical protein
MLWWNGFALKKDQLCGALLKGVFRSPTASPQHFDMVAYSRLAPKAPTWRTRYELRSGASIGRGGGGSKLLTDLQEHADDSAGQIFIFD